MSVFGFKCRVCGHDSYTGPFSTTLYECDNCSAVFGNPKKWTPMSSTVDDYCVHEWHTFTGGQQCLKCGKMVAIGYT